MAVLGVMYLPLPSSASPVENLATPIGRLWDHVLQSILEKDGIINVAWSRVTEERHMVVLFTCMILFPVHKDGFTEYAKPGIRRHIEMLFISMVLE